MRTLLATSLAVLALSAGPLRAAEINGCDTDADGHVAADLHIQPDFDLHGDELRIATDDGHDFRVSRDGELHIDAQSVPVSPDTRQALAGYFRAYGNLETHAKEIGMRSASLAFTAILHAMLDNENKADEDARGKEIEASAQNLCQDVLELQTLETRIRSEVPQFGPFVVTDRDAT